MQRAYRVYSRIAAGLFILITLYTVPTTLLHGRLEDDWLHSVLHLASASLGAYVGWSAAGVAPAKVFTWGVGLFYSALGVYGWFTAGFFLGTPFAIPLGVAENVFHLALGVPAVIITVLGAARPRYPERPPGKLSP